MVRDDELTELVVRALRAAAPEVRDVAEQGGFKYQTFGTWRRGERTPGPENVRKLAELLDARSERLRELARELRASVEGG